MNPRLLLIKNKILLFQSFSFAFFIYLFFKHAWATEDAYIQVRMIEQFFAGNGLVWNPHERVQVFTSPLWFFLLVLFRTFSTSHYLNMLLLSTLCCGAMIYVVNKSLRNTTILAFFVLILCFTKSMMDFLTSGLENPLSFLLTTLFLAQIFKMQNTKNKDLEISSFQKLVLTFTLALLTRHDLLGLFFPGFCLVLYRYRKFPKISLLKSLILCTLPFTLWTLFATFYFGFPFPNTAYAKLNTGILEVDMFIQGWNYLYNSFTWDFPTLFVVIFSLYYTATKGPEWLLFVLSGVAIHILYVLRVGGDFMSGRFIAVDFLTAFIILLYQLSLNIEGIPSKLVFKYYPKSYRFAFIWICAFGFFSPFSPLHTNKYHYEWKIDNHGVADEHWAFYPYTSLKEWMNSDSSKPFPIHPWCIDGTQMRDSETKLFYRTSIGYLGYCVGLEKIVIDPLGMSDPFLARLPSMNKWRIGHFKRDVPGGYEESVLSGQNQIQNPEYKPLYDSIKLITQGPLWSKERFKEIYKMNLEILQKIF